ncbi:MAG: hypothetical protein JSW27_24740 [Phycisphaerales bacterium]|nr:MAG: hypothetical protein JSW27_24740 [Phycisphaerales bacterium]
MRFFRNKDQSSQLFGPRTRGKACRRLRRRCLMALSRRLGPDAAWVRRHVAVCPRCRARLYGWRRVELTMRVLKSQPHCLDLLQRANASTIKMLKHDLQEAAQARELVTARSEPSLLERSMSYRRWSTNVAACFVILFLAKSGLFTSLDRVTTGSERLVRSYYASRAGDDLAQEVFDA